VRDSRDNRCAGGLYTGAAGVSGRPHGCAALRVVGRLSLGLLPTGYLPMVPESLNQQDQNREKYEVQYEIKGNSKQQIEKATRIVKSSTANPTNYAGPG
jgi:hypothetical protein